MSALTLPYPFDLAFMQRALAAGLVVGAFAPLIGTFLVQKRMSLIGDGIGHVAFAGVGAGLLLGIWPVWTALLFGVIGALGVDFLRSRGKASGDVALALFFYSGIALGVVLISLGGGLNANILTYLFGQPLTVTASEIRVIAALGAAIAIAMWTVRRVMFAVVTDEDWSRVAGPAHRLHEQPSCRVDGVCGGGGDARRGHPARRRADGAPGCIGATAGPFVPRDAPVVRRHRHGLRGRGPDRVAHLEPRAERCDRPGRRVVLRHRLDRQTGGAANLATGGARVSPAVETRPVHQEVAERLRRAGQRYTPQRRRLIDILARAGDPLTIPEIIRRHRGLPQSSVYRNLGDLEDVGVVRRISTDEDFGRYELTEDLTGHHHHLVCSSCGRTTDITLAAGLERDLDTALDAVAREADFADVGHRLDLIGTCADCARKARGE